jgi:hypothetical protein
LVREILLTRESEVAEYPTAVRLYTRFLGDKHNLVSEGTSVPHHRF